MRGKGWFSKVRSRHKEQAADTTRIRGRPTHGEETAEAVRNHDDLPITCDALQCIGPVVETGFLSSRASNPQPLPRFALPQTLPVMPVGAPGAWHDDGAHCVPSLDSGLSLHGATHPSAG